MKQKKGSASTEPRLERRRSVKGYGIREPNGPENCKVEFYPDGVAMVAPHIGNSTGKGAPPRSEISVWSKSSRRRMREFLLTNRLPENMVGFSCTFTIPGPPLPAEKMNQLKNTWQIYLRRAGACAIWRAEVQKRGSLHYHLIAGLPLKPLPGVQPEFNRECNGISGARVLKDVWLRSLASLGPVEWWVVGEYWHGEKMPPCPDDRCRVELKDGNTGLPVFLELTTVKPESMWGVSRFNGSGCPSNLAEWWGAADHAADVKPLSDVYGAWKRYLNDHTSKAKQEQIGENIGRHWGVIGRNAFEAVQPVAVASLSWQQYATVLRCYHRLCTPYIRCEGALFGKRRGYSSRRGRSGRSISFSNPATMRRLVDWAKTF